jgi:hypothetical protein
VATCGLGLVIDGRARGLKFRQIKHHGKPFDFGSRIPYSHSRVILQVNVKIFCDRVSYFFYMNYLDLYDDQDLFCR